MEEEVEVSLEEQEQFIQDTTSNKHRFYIDDNHLTQILTEWKLSFWDENGILKPVRPRIPEAVGAAIWDMAEQMGKRHNFANYTYLSEMKSDGIIHCVKYIHNFNPLKKSEKKGKVSAYGYINMIIWRSFTNRIKVEKREQYLKYKSFELMGGMDAFNDEELSVETGDDGSKVTMGMLGSEFMDKIAEYERDNPSVVTKKDKTVAFDNFLFDMGDDPEESESDDDEDEIFKEMEFE